MNQSRFHNAPPASHNQVTQSGFTLVEISIVMIIIGLLIGGIFGGMKLIDNASVQRTVQDIKAIDTAIITFRDTYRALPGDIRNPSTRIPDCTTAPCATSGNGDRTIGVPESGVLPITSASENYTFWHHLSASDILSMGYKNTTDMNFGEGTPDTAIGGGFRIQHSTIAQACRMGGTGPWTGTPPRRSGHRVVITGAHNGRTDTSLTISCLQIMALDQKIDDGFAVTGEVKGIYCSSLVTFACEYDAAQSNGVAYIDFKGL